MAELNCNPFNLREIIFGLTSRNYLYGARFLLLQRSPISRVRNTPIIRVNKILGGATIFRLVDLAGAQKQQIAPLNDLDAP